MSTDPFNVRMFEMRGSLSREKAASRAARILQRDVSTGMIRRLEGHAPAISEVNADPALLGALALVYKRKLDEMSPRARGILVAVGGDGWAARDSNPEPAESLPEAA